MAPRKPDKDPHAPTTAVIQVADDVTATLYLGTELVEHAVGVDRTVVMRVLADYAAAINAPLRVTIQMPDGTWTRHWLGQDGRVTPASRHMPVARSAARPGGSIELTEPQRVRTWGQVVATRAPRGLVVAVLLMLAAALLTTLLAGGR